MSYRSARLAQWDKIDERRLVPQVPLEAVIRPARRGWRERLDGFEDGHPVLCAAAIAAAAMLAPYGYALLFAALG